MGKHPAEMGLAEYGQWIDSLPTVQLRIMSALRESRWQESWWAPPYSSGTGDVICQLIKDLRREWGLPAEEDKDYWYDPPR